MAVCSRFLEREVSTLITAVFLALERFVRKEPLRRMPIGALRERTHVGHNTDQRRFRIAFYGPEGCEPVSTLSLRITPKSIAWVTEDRLLYIVRGSSIGSIDRATGNVQSFDAGEMLWGAS